MENKGIIGIPSRLQVVPKECPINAHDVPK